MELNIFFPDLFSIDYQTNYLTNIAPFDRENSVFDDYLVPQIRIKLNLRCNTIMPLRAANDVSVYSKGFAMEEIFYSKSVTHLHIIIIDENDNSPVFTNPPAFIFTIGFPSLELAEQLKPQHLIHVEAYDIDEGLNAKIKFSLDNYDHFMINSELGIVYPLKGCMQDVDNVTIIVKAIDRDGGPDGKLTEKPLRVVKIQAQNVVEFSIDNDKLEDIPAIIGYVSNRSGIDLRLINFFAIPSIVDVEGKQTSGESKIMVYAYALNNLQSLLNSHDIVETLNELEISSSIVFAQFKNHRNSDCSFTGLIVAVSILGSLLVLIATGLTLFWFLWLRHKFNDSSEQNSNLSAKKLEEDFDTQSEETYSTAPAVEVLVTNEDETHQTDAEVLGIQIDGVTQGRLFQSFSNFKYDLV